MLGNEPSETPHNKFTSLKDQVQISYRHTTLSRHPITALFHNICSQNLVRPGQGPDYCIPHHPIASKHWNQNAKIKHTYLYVATSTTPLRKRTHQPRKRQWKLTCSTCLWKWRTYPTHLSMAQCMGHPHARSRQDSRKRHVQDVHGEY